MYIVRIPAVHFVLLAVLLLAGCRSMPSVYGDTPESKEAPRSTKKPSTAVKASETTRATPTASRTQSGQNTLMTRALPTGDRATSEILVTRSTPREVVAGNPYAYSVKVTNITDHRLEDVVLKEMLDKGFDLKSTSPAAKTDGGNVVWVLGDLAAGESRTVTVNGAAKSTGRVVNCNEVEWSHYFCSTTDVVKPALRIVKSGPSAVIICDPIEYKIRVTNTGTGTARAVVIEDRLPAGLRTLGGKSVARFNVGDLNANQTREIVLKVKAAKTGTFRNRASAVAASGLRAESSETTVLVVEPVLTIDERGPAKAFVNGNMGYIITVTNRGNGPANDAMVENVIPSGASFVSAGQGGVRRGNKIVWNLGSLRPNQSRKLDFELKASSAASLKNTATAKAYCTKVVSDSVATLVTGIPAILLEVVDVEDPIQINGTETYLITVTNQGSAAGTNIRIDCMLEDTMEFVSGSGTTRVSARGDRITIAPLGSLAPKKTATWRVKVKAVGDGDVRFKVSMKSDQLTRPVEETEATNFYK